MRPTDDITSRAVLLLLAVALCSGSRVAYAADADSDPYGEPDVPIARGIAEVMAPRLLHDAVTEGRQGSAISITVAVQSDLRFDKIVLAYRGVGTQAFLGRTMREAGSGSYATEIPATATTGTDVSYFIEAQDKDGRALATRGSLEKPFVITLLPGETPVPPKGTDPTGRASGADDEIEISLDRSKLRLFVGLLVGSGAGWVNGTGDLNADVRLGSSSFALAKLGHIAPEVGVWIAPTLLLSVQGRLQRVIGTTDLTVDKRTYHAANYAAALFAKATWLFGRGRLQPTFSLAAGLGRIRHVVTLSGLTDCGEKQSQTCVDTIASGPILAGAGGGLLFRWNDRMHLVAQANTQIGTPDFTVNIDLSLGVAAKF